MKKILFIFHDTNMTGSSITLFRMIENIIPLNKYDIHIAFASEDGPMLDLFKPYNVAIHPFKKHSHGNLFIKLLTRIVHFFKYPFFLYNIRPDLVYSNTLMNIGEVILSRIMGINTLVHAHEGKDIIRKYVLPIKVEDCFVDEYIVVSNYALQSLNMFTRQGTKKHVIYNGIKPSNQTASYLNKNTTIRLSVIATIHRNKAQLIAIKALELLLVNTSFSIQLNFFGKLADTTYYNELQEYINNKNLTQYVHFHGEITEQNQMYNQTDILLITSLDETFSLTALEALNTLTPVIASNVGGLSEVIENNISGLLFEVGNFQELSEQIIRIINDDLLREQIINKAHSRVIEQFNIESITKQISAVIDNALNHTK